MQVRAVMKTKKDNCKGLLSFLLYKIQKHAPTERYNRHTEFTVYIFSTQESTVAQPLLPFLPIVRLKGGYVASGCALV